MCWFQSEKDPEFKKQNKTLDQVQFQRMLKEAPEMKVLKQESECQEKVIPEEGHFEEIKYNGRCRA